MRIAPQQVLHDFRQPDRPVLFVALFEALELSIQRQDGVRDFCGGVGWQRPFQTGKDRQIMEIGRRRSKVAEVGKDLAGRGRVVVFEHGQQARRFKVHGGVAGRQNGSHQRAHFDHQPFITLQRAGRLVSRVNLNRGVVQMIVADRQNDEANRFEPVVGGFVLRQDTQGHFDCGNVDGDLRVAPQERQRRGKPRLRRGFYLLHPERLPRRLRQVSRQPGGGKPHPFLRMAQIVRKPLEDGLWVEVPGAIGQRVERATTDQRVCIVREQQQDRHKISRRHPAKGPGHAGSHKG